MFEATGWSLEEEGKDNAKFDMLMPSVVKPPKTCDLILDEGQYPHEVREIIENADIQINDSLVIEFLLYGVIIISLIFGQN